MSNSISKKIINGFALGLLFVLSTVAIKAEDLKLEDILARHLDSIGTKEKRDEIKNRMAIGMSTFESKLPARKTGGKFIIVSEADNLFFLSSFNSENYPYEKIGCFSGKISIPFVTLGVRSPLGAFMNEHNKSLSEGLFTGSISSMWNLLNPQMKKGKMEAAGIKKIDGRKAYVVDYYEGGSGSSFTIKMFFDAETFQHVRTEYRDVIAPKEAKFGTLGQESGVETVLTESFGDFKSANGLTLPHLYKVYYMNASGGGVYEYTWDFKIDHYEFNKKYAPDFFNFL